MRTEILCHARVSLRDEDVDFDVELELERLELLLVTARRRDERLLLGLGRAHLAEHHIQTENIRVSESLNHSFECVLGV